VRTAVALIKVKLLISWLVIAGTVAGPSLVAAPLIIDHTAVSAFTNLTALDVARAKKMWISYAGESHATAFPLGCRLLSNAEPRFAVSTVTNGPPDGATTNCLRVNGATWGDVNFTEWRYSYGEEDWYTSDLAVARTKEGIRYCNANISGGLEVLAFGWCWDMEWHNPAGGGTNTTYWTRWAGSSEGGPDGDQRWGLTAADYPLTGNRVCMDTYLQATEEYRRFCSSNGFRTRVIFTTGPADASGEGGYQESVKNQYIRNYVSKTTDGILFDYADILCWDQNGQKTSTWTDWNNTLRIFPQIADDNFLDLDGAPQRDDGDHIGERGALRLAKALWYMLARIAAINETQLRPVLQVTRTPPDVILIRFMTQPNVTYTLQFNAAPTTSAWKNLVTIPSQPSPESVFLIDHTSPSNSSGFYRVLAQPVP
jgi:hypothetical protein